eukprot:PLAT7223.2.p1 GENE.PLAT7223.2~~PLAT7223.2.p1  ORF type:complete len:531 (-),score=209.90 PLAT7223.2:168-1730(-)
MAEVKGKSSSGERDGLSPLRILSAAPGEQAKLLEMGEPGATPVAHELSAKTWKDARASGDRSLAARSSLASYLATLSCYDIMPESCKVVVFDVDIPVRLAFFALVEHGLDAAPLYDSVTERFVGMVTGSDFINLILYYYHQEEIDEALKGQSIRAWRAVAAPVTQRRRPPGRLVWAKPTDSALAAVRRLLHFGVHRLPVMQPEQACVLSVLTRRSIFAHMAATLREERPLFSQSILEMRIGRFDDVKSVLPSCTLRKVLQMLAECRISALPVVREDGTAIDLYTRGHVMYLAWDRALECLDRTVGEALEMQHADALAERSLECCSKNDSLLDVVRQLAATKVETILCVDAEGRLEGTVSVTDVMSYIAGPLPEEGGPEALARLLEEEDAITLSAVKLDEGSPPAETEFSWMEADAAAAAVTPDRAEDGSGDGGSGTAAGEGGKEEEAAAAAAAATVAAATAGAAEGAVEDGSAEGRPAAAEAAWAGGDSLDELPPLERSASQSGAADGSGSRFVPHFSPR